MNSGGKGDQQTASEGSEAVKLWCTYIRVVLQSSWLGETWKWWQNQLRGIRVICTGGAYVRTYVRTYVNYVWSEWELKVNWTNTMVNRMAWSSEEGLNQNKWALWSIRRLLLMMGLWRMKWRQKLAVQQEWSEEWVKWCLKKEELNKSTTIAKDTKCCKDAHLMCGCETQSLLK